MMKLWNDKMSWTYESQFFNVVTLNYSYSNYHHRHFFLYLSIAVQNRKVENNFALIFSLTKMFRNTEDALLSERCLQCFFIRQLTWLLDLTFFCTFLIPMNYSDNAHFEWSPQIPSTKVKEAKFTNL